MTITLTKFKTKLGSNAHKVYTLADTGKALVEKSISENVNRRNCYIIAYCYTLKCFTAEHKIHFSFPLHNGIQDTGYIYVYIYIHIYTRTFLTS